MDRRSLIGRLGALAAGLTFFRTAGTASVSSTSESPHAEAIAFVIETQQKQIAQAEQTYFKEKGVDWWRGKPDQYHWHDTITRSWSVTRPVAPGVVDSTHWFIVAYSINGIVVCTWSVDTRKRTATLQNLKIEPLPK
jgi:hypothetical protein